MIKGYPSLTVAEIIDLLRNYSGSTRVYVSDGKESCYAPAVRVTNKPKDGEIIECVYILGKEEGDEGE